MYTPLSHAPLKNGETLEIGVVTGPDPEWRPRLTALLSHKGPDTRAHLSQSLETPLDDLRSRYYVGRLGGDVAGQIMIIGDDRCGIMGHVFTRPEHRRKGVCQALLKRVLPHCEELGYRVLCLGTGFETPPYWIYHSFGFRRVGAGNGCMLSPGGFEFAEKLFASAPAQIAPMRWEHWGWVDYLALQPVQPDEELPRSVVLNLKAQESAESPFCSLQIRRQSNPEIQANVLVSETGAVVGWAFLAPDSRWFGDVWSLDVYTHPNFASRLPELAESVTLPEAPVWTYLTSPPGPRASALETAGLKPVASLPGWLRGADGRQAVTLLTR